MTRRELLTVLAAIAAGGRVFANDNIPTGTYLPAHDYRVGDISLQTSYGVGEMGGWICTKAGDKDTSVWKQFRPDEDQPILFPGV